MPTSARSLRLGYLFVQKMRGHRADAVCGHLFPMAGDDAAAVLHYRAAARRTTRAPDRNDLLMKAARLDAKGR